MQKFHQKKSNKMDNFKDIFKKHYFSYRGVKILAQSNKVFLDFFNLLSKLGNKSTKKSAHSFERSAKRVPLNF